MDEKEIEEYMKLADKADEGQASHEELTKLNEFHLVFLRNTYELALQNAEEQRELNDSLESAKQSLEENELISSILAAFIEEKGLMDEFNEYLIKAIDEGIEKTQTILN